MYMYIQESWSQRVACAFAVGEDYLWGFLLRAVDLI